MNSWQHPPKLPNPPIGRRQFLGTGARLGAGFVGLAATGLAACDTGSGDADVFSPSSSSGDSVATTTAPSTSGLPALSGRKLVIVQLNGGNDALNTVVPTAGAYRDLRPSLAVPEADVLLLAGVSDVGLHPSLPGLGDRFADGGLAVLRGIGFEQPNRSHFVSMDRWWRADNLSAPGWLGRVLDELPEQAPLFATALGAGAPLLNGARSTPAVVTSAASFRWAGIDPEVLLDLAGAGSGEGAGGDLAARLRSSYRRAVDAVDDFAVVTGGAPATDDLPQREGAATIAEGLAIAAELLASDVGTELMVVSASGFDTHSGQTAIHQRLLADLDDGITAFMAAMEAAGLQDDVLLVTTSEFGRRAAENASGGCDHGAAGVSFVVGSSVRGGMYGEWNPADLLDGDMRPNIDPYALYTTCLDWIGADAEAVLGRRDDSLRLLT